MKRLRNRRYSMLDKNVLGKMLEAEDKEEILEQEHYNKLTKKGGKIMSNHKPITIIVGGQYGSESKGLIAGHITMEEDIDIAVRTGSINAGHTIEHMGKFYKNQQLPISWINPKTKLIVGAGAYVSPPTLAREIEMIEKATSDPTSGERIFIDYRAGTHTEEHHSAEKGFHERFGSTGEGCMAAIVEKIKRDFSYKRMGDIKYYEPIVCDTVKMLNVAYDDGRKILLEGTQGALLDVHLGCYPFVTSRQTNAANWIMEAGLSPNLEYDVIMVVRTYPIRVAGNSGPMGNEISWNFLANVINIKRAQYGLDPLVSPDVLEEYEDALEYIADITGLPNHNPHTWTDKEKKIHSEKLVDFHKSVLNEMTEYGLKELMKFFETTTVTKKLRRIAELSESALEYTATINRPSAIAVTFLNYVFPHMVDVSTWPQFINHFGYAQVTRYLNRIKSVCQAPIRYISFNKHSVITLHS